MLIYLIILLAIITRFLPHMPNFAPITALAIFAGANLGWKKSVALTLTVRLVSDLFLGFFSWPLMLAVYASHLIGVVMGVWIKRSAGPWPATQKAGQGPALQGTSGWLKIIFSSLGASIIFFLVTNFALLYAEYPHTLNGISEAYINGLPFFRGTIFGDLFYTVALFGAYECVKFIASQKLLIKALCKKE